MILEGDSVHALILEGDGVHALILEGDGVPALILEGDGIHALILEGDWDWRCTRLEMRLELQSAFRLSGAVGSRSRNRNLRGQVKMVKAHTDYDSG